MEPGPPAADSAGTSDEPAPEPNTESFLADLLVDDAHVVVDAITGKASVSKRKAGSAATDHGQAEQKVRP